MSEKKNTASVAEEAEKNQNAESTEIAIIDERTIRDKRAELFYFTNIFSNNTRKGLSRYPAVEMLKYAVILPEKMQKTRLKLYSIL